MSTELHKNHKNYKNDKNALPPARNLQGSSLQFCVTKFILRSFRWLNIPRNSDNLRTLAKVMGIVNRNWYRLRCLVMGSPEKKVQKEAEDLLARLQEAREKPQFVLLDEEGRRLMKALMPLQDKLEHMEGAFGADNEKMSETNYSTVILMKRGHPQFDSIVVLNHGANDGILDFPVLQVHADFVADLELNALVPWLARKLTCFALRGRTYGA